MASVGNTPVRELTDSELRKRLLALGYDVPVSVNREFLVRKLENASATAVGGGGGGKPSKRHSLAVTPSSSPAGSPTTARKRKSMAATPRDSSGSGSRGRGGQHQNNMNSTPMSPLASPMSPPPQGTPQYSPGLSSIGTPATPPLSPFVSRLGSPSPAPPNGETGNHSPRFLSYYNMFKASPSMGGGDGGHGTPRSGGDAGSGGYGYPYNRSIRLLAPPGGFSPVSSVAPPSKTDRNGYAGGAGGSLGVESDWCGGTTVSKVLVGLFVLFFLVIGGLYVRKNMILDPRGLTGEVRNNVDPEVGRQSQPPPPVKKPAAPAPSITSSMTYPICGLPGIDPEACIPKDVVKNSRTLFNTLKDELTQRAKGKGCYADVQEVVSLHDAKSILYKLTDLKKGEVDAAFHGLLLLAIENPRGGLSLQTESVTGSDLTPKDAVNLDINLTKVFATDVHPGFICELWALGTSLAITIAVVAGTGGAVYLGWKGFGYYKMKKKLEEQEIFQIVESVIELLGKQYELAEATDGTAYLAVNHIRDELMPPQERQKKEALWNRVVDYISNHESRIREEIQHISGEEFKVWRWLPSVSPRLSPNPNRLSTANSQPIRMGRFSMPAQSSTPIIPSTSRATAGPTIPKNIYPSLGGIGGDDDDEIAVGGCPTGDPNSNTKWQGQAFETCEGSPNALPTTPTTCLKIRHMFSERDTTVRRSRIEQEILGKCCNARILHIGMDPSSVEGCVYIRCMSKDDARKAFMSLHGWWFDGHLLSVKFLKEERYFSRFPEAKNSTVPMGLSR